MKLYIAVLDEFPDHMVPTLVAHTMLSAHRYFTSYETIPGTDWKNYLEWLHNSYKKVVLRVNKKEFKRIRELPSVYVGHENNTLDGQDSCIVVCPMPTKDLPNVLKYAKMWKPRPDHDAVRYRHIKGFNAAVQRGEDRGIFIAIDGIDDEVIVIGGEADYLIDRELKIKRKNK